MATQVDAAPPDPILNHKFTITIGESKVGATKVSGIENESESVEYREGWEELRMRKQPGMNSNSSVSIEAGVTANKTDLEDWRQAAVLESDSMRREVVVSIMGRGGIIARTVKLTRAWCKKLSLGDLDSGSSEVLVKMIEIEHEGITIGTP